MTTQVRWIFSRILFRFFNFLFLISLELDIRSNSSFSVLGGKCALLLYICSSNFPTPSVGCVGSFFCGKGLADFYYSSCSWFIHRWRIIDIHVHTYVCSWNSGCTYWLVLDYGRSPSGYFSDIVNQNSIAGMSVETRARARVNEEEGRHAIWMGRRYIHARPRCLFERFENLRGTAHV